MKPSLPSTHPSKRSTRAWTAALLATCIGVAGAGAQTAGSDKPTTGTATKPQHGATSTTTGARPAAGGTTSASGTTSGTAATSGSTAGMSTTGSANLERTDRNFIETAAKSGMKEQALSQLAAQKASNEQVREYAEQLVNDHHNVNQQLMQLAQRKGVMLETAAMGGMAHAGMSGTSATSGSTGTARTGSTGTTAGTTGARTDTAGIASGMGTEGTVGASSGGATSGAGTSGTSTRVAGTGTSGTAAGATSGTGATSASGSMAGTTSGSASGTMSGMAAMPNDRDYRNLAQETGRDFDERYVELMIEEHENAVALFEKASQNAKDTEIRSFASQHVSALREHLEEARNLQRVVAE